MREGIHERSDEERTEVKDGREGRKGRGGKKGENWPRCRGQERGADGKGLKKKG